MSKSDQKFFHTLDDDGSIDRQGMVLSQTSDRVTVEFFSWLDGDPNGSRSFDRAVMSGWRFYDSEAAWRKAGDRLWQ